MRKGTFSVETAKPNSAAHNSRKHPPKYLIGFANESDTNYYELIESDNDFIDKAQKLYREKIGQKMQKKQIQKLVKEAVITIKKDQDENTIKELFDKLHRRYGGHNLLELSIHRDEGHFLFRGFKHYPNKSIVKKDGDWYIQSDPLNEEFDIRVDESELTPIYNYHAHAKFTMFEKETGKTARMTKGKMSDRIKFVSNELGLDYNPQAPSRYLRKSVAMLKDEYHKTYKKNRSLYKEVVEIVRKRDEEIEGLEKQVSESHIIASKLETARSSIKYLEREIKGLTEANMKLEADFPRDIYGEKIRITYDSESRMDAQDSYERLKEQYATLEAKHYDLLDKLNGTDEAPTKENKPSMDI